MGWFVHPPYVSHHSDIRMLRVPYGSAAYRSCRCKVRLCVSFSIYLLLLKDQQSVHMVQRDEIVRLYVGKTWMNNNTHSSSLLPQVYLSYEMLVFFPVVFSLWCA